jgi:hypothetical protein
VKSGGQKSLGGFLDSLRTAYNALRVSRGRERDLS